MRLGLGLFLIAACGQETGRHHKSEEELVRPVGCQKQVGLAVRELAILVGFRGNNNRVADNGTEAINLCTELDLDYFCSLQFDYSFLGVALQWGVWRNVRAWRNGGRVRDSLGNLLALVDLGDFILEELVALLADLNDLGALDAPSCILLIHL